MKQVLRDSELESSFKKDPSSIDATNYQTQALPENHLDRFLNVHSSLISFPHQQEPEGRTKNSPGLASSDRLEVFFIFETVSYVLVYQSERRDVCSCYCTNENH